MIKLNHQPKPTKSRIILGLLANLTCSLTIVFLNKWLYSYKKFPNVSLTCLHFLTTSVGLYLSYLYGLFEKKFIQIKEIIWLSITFCGFVVCTNLSLQNNTVGTYQLAKVMTTPVIMVLQSYFYEKSFSGKIKMTMVPITFIDDKTCISLIPCISRTREMERIPVPSIFGISSTFIR